MCTSTDKQRTPKTHTHTLANKQSHTHKPIKKHIHTLTSKDTHTFMYIHPHTLPVIYYSKFICLSKYFFTYLNSSIYLFVFWFLHVFIHLLVYSLIYSFIHPFTYSSKHLYIICYFFSYLSSIYSTNNTLFIPSILRFPHSQWPSAVPMSLCYCRCY